MEHVSIDKNKNIIQNIRNKNEAVFIIETAFYFLCLLFAFLITDVIRVWNEDSKRYCHQYASPDKSFVFSIIKQNITEVNLCKENGKQYKYFIIVVKTLFIVV